MYTTSDEGSDVLVKSEPLIEPSTEPSPESPDGTFEPSETFVSGDPLSDALIPSLEYAPTKSICNEVFDELVQRFDVVQKNKTRILDYKETVKGMVPRNNRKSSTEIISTSRANEVCYVSPSSTSVHVVSAVYTDVICQFGCIKQYWKLERTGDIVLFLYGFNCRKTAFTPCTEDLKLNPELGFKFSVTTSNRKPISAVIQITDPDGNREKAIKNAIRRLQGAPGFGNIPQYDIETKVIRNGKFRFRVILRFNLTYI